MSIPAAKSSTLSYGDMGACREASNHGVTDVESQNSLSAAPSQVSFMFEFPSEETNICFNLNPSLRKLTALCYENGARTFLKGRCERSRNYKDYENPTASASSVDQRVVQSTQSTPKELLLNVNATDLSKENLSPEPNSFSFDQASNNYKMKPPGAEQKMRHNFSDGSVMSVENYGYFQTTGRSEMNGTFIETKRWVENTPEIIETVTSYTNVTSSATSFLVENLSEEREHSRKKNNQPSSDFLKALPASLEKNSRERYTDSAKNVVYRCLDMAIEPKPHSLSSEKSIKRFNEDGKDITTLPDYKDSRKSARFVANVTAGLNIKNRMSRKSSTEVSCQELCEDVKENNSDHSCAGSDMAHKENFKEEVDSSTTSQLTESEYGSSLAREPLGPTRSRKRVIKLTVDTDTSTDSKAKELSRKTKTKSKIFHKRTMRELYKLFQNYMAHNKHKHEPKEAFVEVLQETAKNFLEGAQYECGQNGVENLKSADNEFVRSDDDPSSCSASRVSVAETYDIDSSPSCRTIDMQPTRSETTDFDGFDGSEITYRRVTKELGRKKKSPLYSETQSSGFVPEARYFGAGTTSAATSSVATEGDGTSNRRQTIDRGVRIGHTSMNYFLSWDSDDLVQQEHMYNSTGLGVQDGGHESQSTRSGALPKRKYHNRRLEAEDAGITEIDLGTSLRSASKAGGNENSDESADEKGSVSEEKSMGSGRSRVDGFYSNEPVDLADYYSESPSFEVSSSYRDLEISKSSTNLYTLFSTSKVPLAENQSDTETNEDRKVKLIFTKNNETSLKESSCSGLLMKPSLDASKKAICETVAPPTRPEWCASAETYAAKRKKRHRLTKQAQLYLQEYDKASTTGSEECMSVDQLDVSNSSIVLRRKPRKKSAGGMTFLRLRKTHPCRNLPGLMLKQEIRSSLSVCSAVESSESQIIKEISFEGIEDYSGSCCKQTQSMSKLTNVKWVKSMDDFIDFAYIAPKITRLGNDEQIFKKSPKIVEKLLENSEVEKRQAAVDNLKSSVGKRPSFTLHKGVQKTEMKSKLKAFRADRRRKYNLVKVDTCAHVPPVDSQPTPVDRPQNVKGKANEMSKCSRLSQNSKENGENVKKPTETSGNESGSKVKRMQVIPGKRKVAAFLGCVTVKNSDNETTPQSNVTRISTPCNQGSDKSVPVVRKLVENEDGKCSNDRFNKGKEYMRKMRTKQVKNEEKSNVSDCSNSRREVENTFTRSVLESEDRRSTDARGLESATENSKTIAAEIVANNMTEFPASKKDVGKKFKRRTVVIGAGGGTSDTVDGRRRTEKQSRKKVIDDGGSTSDCVKKVSFDEAYCSLRAKKGTVLSDDSWISDDTASAISEQVKPRVIVREVANGVNTEHKVELGQKSQNIRDTDSRNRTESADLIKRCLDLRNKIRDNVARNELKNGSVNSNTDRVDNVGSSSNKNQVDLAQSSKKIDSFVMGIKKKPEHIQTVYKNFNASVHCDSVTTNTNTEPKCSTPTSKTSSKYQPGSSQSVEKQETVATNSANKIESAIQNQPEATQENLKQTASIKRSRSPRAIFRSVQKPKKNPENHVPVTEPILDEAQKRPKSACTAEEKVSAKTTGDARARAAEYDRKNRLRLRRELEIQKQGSVSSTRENGVRSERERFVNTGQAVLTTTGT